MEKQHCNAKAHPQSGQLRPNIHTYVQVKEANKHIKYHQEYIKREIIMF